VTATQWWQGGVIYQIYVRSWRDTNGDGYGDLRGVISGLDHLSWLGVDAIWLSPTMPSPDQDWGYDVSDYTGVHPELGTMADLDELVAEAGRRGIAVLLDLVPNHTSSAHPWFADARSSRDAVHRDYYVWADPGPDGGPPNNWQDATGQPAWQWDAGTGQYYLHNFLPSQPDMNWWQPAVHAEFEDILRFWFNRGVAGFRIDVAHGLYKDAELRDNPPIAERGPLTGWFGLQPVYNVNRPETHGVYRDWRRIAESYQPPRLLLGETWVPDERDLASYYGKDDELQLAFNFPFVFTPFTAPELADATRRMLDVLPESACPVWTASNHDVGRFPSRWCGSDERQTRLAMLFLATLPGTLVLYYGDEAGMTDGDVPESLRRDPMTRSLPAAFNRDRARTPMRWDDSGNGGFTAPEVTPWLPVSGSHGVPSIAAQRSDEDSVLSLCQRLLALRRAELGGGVTQFTGLSVSGGLLTYQVAGLLIAANLSGEQVALPAAAGDILIFSARQGDQTASGMLGPWEGVIARVRSER
jgi:alpha-glucosidase